MMSKKRYVDIASEMIFQFLIYFKIIILRIFSFSSKTKFPIQSAIQEKVFLNNVSTFAVFAGLAVNNEGKSKITGDCGICPDYSVEGFPPGILIGKFHLDDSLAVQAKRDLIIAYNETEKRTCSDAVELIGNIGGLTLVPGLYYSKSTVDIKYHNLIFDALGNSNAVFIIQIVSDLIIKTFCKVILKGNALASNIFWQVGNSATFETASCFKGTVMAMHTIMLYKGAKLDGRMLTIEGAVFMTGNLIAKQ